MITAILDTNVILSAAIGSRRGAAARTLDAYFAGKYQLAFSPATSDELLEVLCLPHLRLRHGWSDEKILRFILALHAAALIAPGRQVVPASIARDITDTKFLSVAAELRASFLVTKDRRHLLRRRKFGTTRIVTPAQFLKELE
jgi:putative PIN family toxin of toxin-antitoxin system